MSITIFTDGSSRGNPGPGGWGAIICTNDRVVELGGGDEHTTNNRMELMAAINALAHVDENDLGSKPKTEGVEGRESTDKSAAVHVVVKSDSKYLIRGITEWIPGWQKNGWKTAAKKDVENKDLWQALSFVASGLSLKWEYIEGHAGHPGNERCDEIATAFADKADPRLYKGPRRLYMIDLNARPRALGKTASGRKYSSAKAYSYLSLVDGVLQTHDTWEECEARVKGVKGAKFKKSISPEDEKEIIKKWGM